MRVKTKVFVENLKRTIKQWDEAFDQFQIKEYPIRLRAQVQYREQIGALIATRLLVEERMLNLNQR
jgi:hypothetical protein